MPDPPSGVPTRRRGFDALHEFIHLVEPGFLIFELLEKSFRTHPGKGARADESGASEAAAGEAVVSRARWREGTGRDGKWSRGYVVMMAASRTRAT